MSRQHHVPQGQPKQSGEFNPQFDPTLARNYGGKWVILWAGEVIAADENARIAREKAEVYLSRHGIPFERHDIVAVAIAGPGTIRT